MLLPAGPRPAERALRGSAWAASTRRARSCWSWSPAPAALVADPTVPVDAELLDAAATALRIVANFAVGYDNVDLEACRRRGIVVTNTPDVLTKATAELALALTLAAGRRMSDAERDLRDGRWTGWDPGAYLGPRAARGDGRRRRPGPDRRPLRASWSRRSAPSSSTRAGRRSPRPSERWAPRRVELRELLEAADVVSLHAPADPETHHLIGARGAGPDRPGGRPGQHLARAAGGRRRAGRGAGEGRLGAAGLDVYEDEPEVPPALLEAPRCVLLPHIGSATFALPRRRWRGWRPRT